MRTALPSSSRNIRSGETCAPSFWSMPTCSSTDEGATYGLESADCAAAESLVEHASARAATVHAHARLVNRVLGVIARPPASGCAAAVQTSAAAPSLEASV